MNCNDTLFMKHPATFPSDPARDGIPLGNGKTGVMVQGGAGTEVLTFVRYDLWQGAVSDQLPKTDDVLQQMRALIDQGNYTGAKDLLCDRLQQEHYSTCSGWPVILGALRIHFEADGLFSGYRRILHMDSAECEVQYRRKTASANRTCFVSREDDTLYYEYTANEDTDITISFGLHQDCSPNTDRVVQALTAESVCVPDGMDFFVRSPELTYGVKIRVFGVQAVQTSQGELQLRGKYFRLAVRCCSDAASLSELQPPADFLYEARLQAHLPLHRALYETADIHLSEDSTRSNEALLDEAYEDVASPELIEKMWRFGRYLFICGTCEDGLPFPLYGLWPTKHYALWSQYVENENVEIIYWHANTGGLARLVRPLIRFYTSAMETFRTSARQLFGCKGIYVSSYTTPIQQAPAVPVPVIIHFTGAAGWLCQHFFRYYQMTGDRQLLEEQIFPFMLETADFYLDYIRYDETGTVVYYPCVSPENTPGNLIDAQPDAGQLDHPNPVTKNAVMELAIIKDLFTNLISLIRETGQHTDYLPALEHTLVHMPAYGINADGALKEWASPELDDNYDHRHVSHIFPLFPGEEFSKEETPELYAAAERAVDLRRLGAQSGWSLAHMAAIYATLGRGGDTLECLDTLLKGCTLQNFMTLHNDYRNMGVTLSMEDRVVPVQLDAAMGFVNAVQMMLLQERKGCLSLLPALPDRLSAGSVSKLHFSAGHVSMVWNREPKLLEATVTFTRAGSVTLRLPEEFSSAAVHSHDGICSVTASGILLQAEGSCSFSVTT